MHLGRDLIYNSKYKTKKKDPRHQEGCLDKNGDKKVKANNKNLRMNSELLGRL